MRSETRSDASYGVDDWTRKIIGSHLFQSEALEGLYCRVASLDKLLGI